MEVIYTHGGGLGWGQAVAGNVLTGNVAGADKAVGLPLVD